MTRRNIAIVVLLAVWLMIGPAAAQLDRTYPEVGPGLTYVHERIGDVPWAIHILKIDRQSADFRLISSLAQGTIFGLAGISKHVGAVPSDLGTPIAAINGDFYHIAVGPYQGDPTGLQIVQGELVSAPGGPSFWIDSAGKPQIGEVQSQLKVTWPDSSTTPIGLNEERKDDAAILYTPILGPSTRTKDGREMILECVGDGPWLPVRPGQTYKACVREVRDSGDTPLSPDTMILSLGPNLVNAPTVVPGDQLRITMATSPDLTGVDVAIGGHPILVADGKRVPFGPGDPRHPRTMIGWNSRYLYFVVVDGRQTGLSAGMTNGEMASLMRRLACTDAMNLDGGGSSTFWLGGRVMNVPSDGRERGIANALILLRKPASAPAN